MSENKAVELRHDGKTFRAGSREIFFRWAREHRISIDDSYRIAGTEKWIPVTANNELNILLDPENWWKIKMGGKTYVASDWDSIVKWAKEGRLSVDVQIEGPKTPPGGILGKASTELSPYLREWIPDDPDQKPLRIRFDSRTFIPGEIDTLKNWIRESRIPVEAEVSIQGEDWQLITDCGLFDNDLWPTEASLNAQDKSGQPDAVSDSPPVRDEPPLAETPGQMPEVENADRDDSTDEQQKPYRITTTYGEDYVFTDPEEILSLLKRKRVNSFDEVKHPDLPDGAIFVSEFMREFMPHRKASIILIILAVLFGCAGTASIVFQQQDAQWMLAAGITSLAVSLILLIRIIWKK